MHSRLKAKNGEFDISAWRDTVESAAARFRRMGFDEAEVSSRVIAYMDMIEGDPIIRNELRLEPVTTDSTRIRKPAKRKPRKPATNPQQLGLFD